MSGRLSASSNFPFVCLHAVERLVEGGEGGVLGEEDCVETRRQRRDQRRIRGALISLGVAIEIPDLAANALSVLALLIVALGHPLTSGALGIAVGRQHHLLPRIIHLQPG